MPPGFENRQVLPALWVRLPPSSPKNIRNVFPDFRLSVRSELMKKCENSCSGKNLQQCDNGSRPAWKAGVPKLGLEVRILSAAPYGSVVQSVRMLACHARGHGFKSRRSRQAFEIQLVK